MWIHDMSGDAEEQPEEPAVEEAPESNQITDLTLKARLYRMVYNQPTIVLSILETLFELLEARGIMKPGEAEQVIQEGLRRWRDQDGT